MGLVALAVAVALWGFGYKISLYSVASDPLPKVPVAKVWIEHRYGFAAAFRLVASHEKRASNLDFGPQLLAARVRPLLLGSCGCIFNPPPQTRSVLLAHPSLSPRSPPSLS